MGHYLDSHTQAANAGMQAAQVRAQGQVQRRQAYENAYKLESDSRARGAIVGDNMMRAGANAVARLAVLRAQQGGSGFAEAGSKLRAEQSTAEVLSAAIADMGRSYAVSDQNERNQANVFRHEGDAALELANIQGDFYDRMARIQRKVAPWFMLGEGLQLGSQALMMFNMGGNGGAGDGGKSGGASGGTGGSGGGSGSSGGGGS